VFSSLFIFGTEIADLKLAWKDNSIAILRNLTWTRCFPLKMSVAFGFNDWTSTVVVIDGDGKVRKPLFSLEGADS